MSSLPEFETLSLLRDDPRLTIIMNRADVQNAFGGIAGMQSVIETAGLFERNVVGAFCEKLLLGAVQAIHWIKTTVNLELKHIAHALMDLGVAFDEDLRRKGVHKAHVSQMPVQMGAKGS